LTARQELSRQRVGLASPDNSDTHDSNGGRGRSGRRGRRGRRGRCGRRGRRDGRRGSSGSSGGATSYTSAASVEDREPAELQATWGRLWWRTGDVAQRRRWRTGAGGHRWSPQPESWTGGGAASARTRRAEVYALLDWDNLPGRATRLLRLE
jgi:hypothetical protein